MSAPSRNISARTFTNSRYVTVTTVETDDDYYEPFQYHEQHSPNNVGDNSSSSHKRTPRQNKDIPPPRLQSATTPNVKKKNQNDKREQQSKNNSSTNKDNVSQEQKKEDKVPIRAVEFTSQHLTSLKNSYDKILKEQFISRVDYDAYLSIYHRLRDVILAKRPDAQIILYGSLLFNCCLKDRSNIDIDIQFNEILPYETLKEILEIVRNSTFCKEAHFNTEHEQLCIDLSILNSNILVRLTSNNTRAIQLSDIVHTYTKFDERVLPLLRLFRILSQTCNIDRPDQGTLHPIVFHLMVIHFLQQLDPPILPCLHEYVFGIDKSPVALSSDQYTAFFQICTTYSKQWKSNNTTSIEMLFLQLLSYYVRQFNIPRFVVSIQTRMPILKNERQILNRRLFCNDPTAVSRNICYTMKVNSSFKYFQSTLKAALNYFCQTYKNETTDKDLLRTQLINTLVKSYKLFIERLPKKINYIRNLQQDEIRQYYRKTFDIIPDPILSVNVTNVLQLLQENDEEENIEKISPHDVDLTLDIIDDNDDDNQPIELDNITINEEQTDLFEHNQPSGDEPVSFAALSQHLNNNQKEILRKEYDQQVKIFNDKMQQILNDIKSTSDLAKPVNEVQQKATTDITPEFFYDMQPEHFGAEKGAPSVCTICYKTDHNKSDCPELVVPNIVNLPRVSQQWIHLITRVCRQVTDQCKSSKQDKINREEILRYLQNIFGKCYPSCAVYAYGSSHNGFGLRQSDLDICVVLKDKKEETSTIILEKLFQIIKSNPQMFKDIELVVDARVPVIRSIHTYSNIEIDITLDNILAMENTRLLKIYTQIDSRVPELGYMIKHLIKTCDIGDARFGDLSSYAYIIMMIHFLQQIQPAVLPVLQQLNGNPSNKDGMIRKCDKWNVYFYDNVSTLKQVWVNKNGPNRLTTGELWVEFLRYYTEIFDYKTNVVTIRQIQPLQRYEKGWFKPTIAIEDPFILTHDLADRLSLQKWALIRRVFIRARQHFCTGWDEIDTNEYKLSWFQACLFDINILCPETAERIFKVTKYTGGKNKQNKKSKSAGMKSENKQTAGQPAPLMQTDNNRKVSSWDEWNKH